VRRRTVSARYDHWTNHINSGGHVEGLPKVRATVDMTRATNINLR
jgi:hypothetical protein